MAISYRQLNSVYYYCHCQSQSQSYIATGGRSISKSWCRAPSGAHDQIFIIVWQLRSCFCGTPHLTKGRACLLCMLLALVSAVFLGSESLGSRDHILLSQFWDFSFRRLLRLAGSYRTLLITTLHGPCTENTYHVTATQPVHWRASCCLAVVATRTCRKNVTWPLPTVVWCHRGHKENTAPVLFAACVLRVLLSSGFTSQNIITELHNNT
jgi:hypothetical protein